MENISKYFTVDNMKETRLYGYVYDDPLLMIHILEYVFQSKKFECEII